MKINQIHYKERWNNTDISRQKSVKKPSPDANMRMLIFMATNSSPSAEHSKIAGRKETNGLLTSQNKPQNENDIQNSVQNGFTKLYK